MSIAPEDLALLSAWFDETLALDHGSRETWMAARPAAQSHLLPLLREMLALQGSTVHLDYIADGPRLDPLPAESSLARAGDRVGPYRLLREIGRGGMGAVWLSDRVDGTLSRQVALKLPRLAWDEGLGERMARERDIGALLEHPNIARLYDAGLDEQGRPYLALEYIDGQRIDAWCEALGLDLPARLRLFLQVTRAVAYAHGRLVVHRDLKPSNVLVTPDGQVHLLDFGIAKRLTDTRAAEDDSITRERGHALTPSYASPEQLQGRVVTVASDVYSLGVLLHELVTGGRQKISPEGDAWPASRCASDPTTAKALRGELDAILGKALKREPGERYATADAMAADIERHLAGERVLAQPDSWRYRTAKGLRRHRVGVAAAGAVLVVLLAGVGASVVQAQRAHDAAARAVAVKEFVVEVFRINERGSAGQAELRQLPVEMLLEHGAGLIETKFRGQPQLQAELYGVVGGIFADMGSNEQAATYATRQIELQVAMGARPDEQAQALMLLAQALLAQGRLSDARLRAQRALALTASDAAQRPAARVLLARVLLRLGAAEEARRMLDLAEPELAGQPVLRAVAARAKQMRAWLLLNGNHFDAALPLYLSAIDDALAAEGPLSPAAVEFRLSLANSLTLQDRDGEAAPYRDAALAALRKGGTAGEVRAALAEVDIFKTLFLNRRKRYDDARAAIERNRAMLLARGRQVPEAVKAAVELDLGLVQLVWGDLKQADPLISRAAAVLQPLTEGVMDRYVLADIQGIAAMNAGRHDQADALFRQELDMQRLAGGATHPDRAFDIARVAFNRSMQSHFDEAESAIAAAPAFEPLKGADANTVRAYREVLPRALARVKLDRGQAAAALGLLPPPQNDDDDVPFPFEEKLLRGEALCGAGRPVEGLALLEPMLLAHRDKDYEHSPPLARARAVTGLCALAAGRRTRAQELAAAARRDFADQPMASPYFKRPLEQLTARLAARSRGS